MGEVKNMENDVGKIENVDVAKAISEATNEAERIAKKVWKKIMESQPKNKLVVVLVAYGILYSLAGGDRAEMRTYIELINRILDIIAEKEANKNE